MIISCTHEQFASILVKSKSKDSSLILDHLNKTYTIPNHAQEAIKTKLNRCFLPIFFKKWKNSFYSEDRFRRVNSKWLSELFSFHVSLSVPKKRKSFEDVSASTKKRRMHEVLSGISNVDLVHARVKKTRYSDSYKKAQSESHDTQRKERKTTLSTDEALALFIDAKLTKHQYCIIRQTLLENGVNVFPAYRHITTAKTNCCPSFQVTQTGACAQLQSVLDHTANRIVQIAEVQRSILENRGTNVELLSKFGCDGTSGFTQYKQAFTEAKGLENNSVVLMCTVPLSLQPMHNTTKTRPFWRNDHPSSTRLCRPIKFEYQKETSAIILSEIDSIQKQVDKLLPTTITVQTKQITIKHTLFCTMIDGKVRQAVTETASAATCCICNARPKEMNDLEEISKKPARQEAYRYGLSSLHAWIRNMEWILHLAYKLPIQKWNKRLTPDEKLLVSTRTQDVRKRFQNELHMLVDCVKQGKGNTNDGNTARTFFKNYEKVAEITHVDKEFIKNIYIILQVLASRNYPDSKKFNEFCMKTAKSYVQQYPWYPMPASCHSILIHGSAVIDCFSIPIGILSEESQEGRNKDFKKCRENNTRKSQPKLTNEDIMRFLFVSSDPYILQYRHVPHERVQDLLPEAIQLLKPEKWDGNKEDWECCDS